MVEFIEIQDVETPYFKSGIKLYKDSFPENQRIPADIVYQRTKNQVNQFWVGVSQEQVVFMAILHPVLNTDFILLAYIATVSDMRSQGIGARFLKHILNQIKPNKYFLLEVESPHIGNERELKTKRINFYKNLGAKELKNVRYILPPLVGRTPTEMQLMLMPTYSETQLRGDSIKEIVIKIYQEVYCRNKDDLFLNSFIDEIPAMIALC